MLAVRTEQFTLTEAAALVGLNEKQVRKEIEYHIIDTDSPAQLSFSDLVYLYLVPRSPLSLRVNERITIYKRIVQTLTQAEVPEQIEVVDPFYLRLSDKVAHLDDKVYRFFAWKERLGRDPDTMGGAVTFPNTRLTVRHIGGMLERGVPEEEILEDYSYLTLEDLAFARLFVRAYPEIEFYELPMPTGR
ncbi:MAG: DUF433 domain-containing protein [Caldilineaceae bacterium]